MKKLALTIKILAAAVVLASVAIIPTAKTPAFAATYINRGNVKALAYIAGANESANEIAVATSSEIFFINEDGSPALDSAGSEPTEKPSITLEGVTAMAATTDALYAVKGNGLYDTADATSAKRDGVTLIAGDGADLYYYDGSGIRLYNKDGADKSADSEKIAVSGVTSLAVIGGNVYFLADGAVYKNDEIVCFNSSLKSIAAIGGELYGINGNNEIVLVRDESVVYKGKAVSLVSSAGNRLLFATDKDEIYLFDGEKATLVAASASDEEGFYNYPLKAVARLGKLYVADYSNHRISVTGKSNDKVVYEYLSVPRPRAIAVASDGTIYAASNNDIVKLAGGASEKVFTAENAQISDLFISDDDTLYCVAGKAVYSVPDGEKLAENVDGATLLHSGETVVFAGAELGKVTVAEDGSRSVTAIATLPAPIKTIAADNDDNIYALTAGSGASSLYKITNGASELKKADLPTGASSVYVSRSSSPIGAFGDIIVADKNANTVVKVSAEEAGVSPLPSAPEASDFDDDRIFRFAKIDTVLYNTTDEADAAAFVPKDKRVIVLKYDFGYGYAYCAVENEREELTFGYAFRSTLTDPMPYLDPDGEYCVVYSNSVKLYSLPSKGSTAKKDLNKNDLLDMLSFPDCEWYRVQIDGENENDPPIVGYVPVGTVSINSFVPNGDRPQINGEIIEYNGETNALTYNKNADGEYVEIEGVALPAGTKIEITEGFDTSVPYTQIKYYDDRLGTLTCYVKTVHVKFYGISTVQIIAIVIAVLTFILLAVLLLRLYMRRRKI